MYLGPHHFQAQSRYFEDSIRFATSALWFEPWGLVAAQLDAEALKNGTASLVHARGIFSDGMSVSRCRRAIPYRNHVNITDLFPPVRDSITLSLAAVPRRPEGSNTFLPDESASMNGPMRYRAEVQMLFDETTGRDEKPVHIGRKNIALRVDTEPAGEFTSLPIARISRNGSGNFVYDPEFIPPSVALSGSPRLMSLLGRLIEILEDKSTRFSRPALDGMERVWAEFSTREIANFWFLHTVNSALPALRHHYLTKRGHPEQLFVDLLRLGGALCTFAIEAHPRQLPLYDHNNLEKSFGELDHHIRTYLETIIPTQYIPDPARKARRLFSTKPNSPIRGAWTKRAGSSPSAPLSASLLVISKTRCNW